MVSAASLGLRLGGRLRWARQALAARPRLARRQFGLLGDSVGLRDGLVGDLGLGLRDGLAGAQEGLGDLCLDGRARGLDTAAQIHFVGFGDGHRGSRLGYRSRGLFGLDGMNPGAGHSPKGSASAEAAGAGAAIGADQASGAGGE